MAQDLEEIGVQWTSRKSAQARLGEAMTASWGVVPTNMLSQWDLEAWLAPLSSFLLGP